MNTFISLFLCSAILFCGCSSTHHLLKCSDIKNDAEGENALVILESGEELHGKIIKIGVDSTMGKKPISQDTIVIPASEVQKIHLKDHFTGALDGFGYGFLGGFVIGAAIVIPDLGKSLGHGEVSAILIPIVGGIVGLGGGLVGIPFGAIIGHTDKYTFSSADPNEYIKLESFDQSGNFSNFLQPRMFTRTETIIPERIITVSWSGGSIDISLQEELSTGQNNKKAIELAVVGKLKDAKDEFEKSLTNYPIDLLSSTGLKIIEDVNKRRIKTVATVLFFVGIEHSFKFELDKAYEKFNHAIKLNPDYAPFYFLRGHTFLSMGLPDSSINDFNKVIELNPDFNEIYNSRGIAYFSLGQYGDAISDFEKIIQTQPNFFPAYFNKAQSLLKTGQFNEALEVYKSFLKNAPPQYTYHIEYTKKKIDELEKNIN